MDAWIDGQSAIVDGCCSAGTSCRLPGALAGWGQWTTPPYQPAPRQLLSFGSTCRERSELHRLVAGRGFTQELRSRVHIRSAGGIGGGHLGRGPSERNLRCQFDAVPSPHLSHACAVDGARARFYVPGLALIVRLDRSGQASCAPSMDGSRRPPCLPLPSRHGQSLAAFPQTCLEPTAAPCLTRRLLPPRSAQHTHSTSLLALLGTTIDSHCHYSIFTELPPHLVQLSPAPQSFWKRKTSRSQPDCLRPSKPTPSACRHLLPSHTQP